MSLENDLKTAKNIAEKVSKAGGTVYFVGGYVRDLLLGKTNKDIDIEVHGIEPEKLCEILDSIGERLTIGKSFGIYGLRGCGLDIAMPRREKLTGRGHRDFEIYVEPFIGVENAARRRDFTVNALMQNVLTGETVDCFGGINDLKNKILRHVNDESFAEDPLRVLRAAQFAARFDFEIAPETLKIASEMPLCDLSQERIAGELDKALLTADKPSVFFQILRKIGQLDLWFPEVKALIGVEQSPVYHPEGDVWNHTMDVLDRAAKYRDKVTEPLWFMLSALTHDFGKPQTTENSDGKIHSYGHEIQGLPVVKQFLTRLYNEKNLIKYVMNMVENHMKPFTLKQVNASPKSTNKMFDLSVAPRDLLYLSCADKGEEIGNDDYLIKRLEYYNETMSLPYVTGKDLIDNGIKPSESFSELLAYSHKLRLAHIDKDTALKQTLAMAKKSDL